MSKLLPRLYYEMKRSARLHSPEACIFKCYSALFRLVYTGETAKRGLPDFRHLCPCHWGCIARTFTVFHVV
ncbi:hypothetical protein K432DRAFT_182092 [Lepidopterella palustris CBS 459.81]|uniref:Uncharacterized protein n=1 Tax=Lepidopterella palustris CBS 459.81 TaxID=1314670 RepID=A0A8E2E0K9_9PEZI|nr:hypothetical protein K432DRAFT_182092 [Lepidopterella palustris CBS 459.81]